jgi:SAM-dependent methyltransferase
MEDAERWQVSADAAAVYERCFVPAIFGAWAPRVAEAADIGPGDHVLDAACGTGVLAREAAARVGATGSVTGLDLNPGMLAVAAEAAPALQWRQGDAMAMPFADRAFTVVVSQFGLMFMVDRATALREMWRVLSPGGRLAVAVWASVEDAAGYKTLVDVAAPLVGEAAAAVFAAPFVMGGEAELADAARQAGIVQAKTAMHRGAVRFASVEEFVRIEVKGSPLAESLDQTAMDRLAAACESALARFVQPSGEIVMPIAAHILTARKL